MAENKYVIRRATHSDVKIIHRLNKALFLEEHEAGRDDILDISWPDSPKGQKYYQETLADNNKITLIATRKDRPVGYIIASTVGKYDYREKGNGEIESMYVVSSERSCGIGKALIDQVVMFLKTHGVTRVYVSAYSRNEKAISFYDKCGFQLIEVGMEMVL